MHKILDFSKYSSIQIGPKLPVKIISEKQKISPDIYIIGGANNLLISPNPPKLAILSKDFDYIKIEDGMLKVGAATPSGKLLSYCKKHDIKHFEILQRLPGTLGGLVKMNAGLKEYEILNQLLYIKTYNDCINKKDIKFSYRYTNINEPIFEIGFELNEGFDSNLLDHFKNLRSNQPNIPSAGSCFKNPKGDAAGRLIEEVGLKGFKQGNMQFSDKHANFLVNLGGGTFEDAMYLIDLAKQKVLEKFNITLENEIIILQN